MKYACMCTKFCVRSTFIAMHLCYAPASALSRYTHELYLYGLYTYEQ